MKILALRKDLEKSIGLVKFACIKVLHFLTASNCREKTRNRKTTTFLLLFWGRKGRNTKYLK